MKIREQQVLQTREGKRSKRASWSDAARMLRRTLIGGIVNEEVKVVGFSEVVREDDLLLEVENGYPGAVECDPRLCSLGRELVENRGRHKLGKGQTKVYTNKYNWG